ncbi:MAG: 4Fe-4S dicluster domain-containing protein [Desulfovibrio sp.]|jgi:molybdopterin-containing oxidoreductase family iron-sulfur binding subunit|nr:4Fe-4S dicluster domain-containing protein [Desulfovibrio sp.]
MKKRRRFLELAGMSFLALVGKILQPDPVRAFSLSGVGRVHARTLKAKRWAMLIDTLKFNDAEKFAVVIRACHSFHNVPSIAGGQEVKWIWKDTVERVFGEETADYKAKGLQAGDCLLSCNHCDNPACVSVCPVGATFRRPDGIVAMDYHRCIGCRFCMSACPYGARSFNFSDPRLHIAALNPDYPARARGIVEKCGFCSELLDRGEMPLCVKASDGAIVFGDLADPDSGVSRLLSKRTSIRRNEKLGAGPGLYYLI